MIYLITLNPAIDKYLYVDDLKINETNTYVESNSNIGGKAINCAQIISQYTDDYELITTVDASNFKLFEGELSNLKKKLISVPKTRINYKISNNNNITEINEKPAAIGSEARAELLAYISAKATADDFVLIAGSINLEDIEFLNDIKLAINGANLILDVPTLSGDQIIDLKPFLIKPNEHELLNLTSGSDLSQQAIVADCQQLINKGISNIVVSLGGNGSLFVNENEALQIGIPAGKLINAVGAGDSFVGGFLSEYVVSKNIKQALQLAAACGSATAYSEKIGQRAQIDKLRLEIEIKDLKN